MTPFNIAILALLILGLGSVIVLQLRGTTSRPGAAKDDSHLMARLQQELETERKEKNELTGKGKELYGRFKDLESEYKSTIKERDALQKIVTKHETTKEAQEKEYHGMVQKLENAEHALEKERLRVVRDDEARTKMAEEERDRLWNDHENTVIATLADLCKQPHLQFTAFSNNNLPDDFDGSLKPDFLIDFLGQYVVFDAKVSKAQNLQTYIDDQVKKTAEKMKKNSKIYPHIFLVVPTEAVSELKKLVYAKDQYYFYVISREALSPILASLKRISTYELAETLDPQKRENIINILAEMTTQINMTSATSLLTTKRAIEVLARMQKTDPELAAEVDQKSKEKTLNAYSPTEIKRLASSITAQNSEIVSLASPKPPISKKMLEAAQNVISQKLL